MCVLQLFFICSERKGGRDGPSLTGGIFRQKWVLGLGSGMQRIGRVSPDLTQAGLEADSAVSYLLPVDCIARGVSLVGSGGGEGEGEDEGCMRKALSVAKKCEFGVWSLMFGAVSRKMQVGALSPVPKLTATRSPFAGGLRMNVELSGVIGGACWRFGGFSLGHRGWPSTGRASNFYLPLRSETVGQRRQRRLDYGLTRHACHSSQSTLVIRCSDFHPTAQEDWDHQLRPNMERGNLRTKPVDVVDRALTTAVTVGIVSLNGGGGCKRNWHPSHTAYLRERFADLQQVHVVYHMASETNRRKAVASERMEGLVLVQTGRSFPEGKATKDRTIEFSILLLIEGYYLGSPKYIWSAIKRKRKRKRNRPLALVCLLLPPSPPPDTPT
ncbi:hypothetical protein BKA61DRAFT_651633 [Leptodontidium sp. MPI-SDFR-AT-0119]|nr:hypothetical protein BKA61DRAFT_651633 [Leptodontidium sp. MPI-SDFR-AT-0119]